MKQQPFMTNCMWRNFGNHFYRTDRPLTPICSTWFSESERDIATDLTSCLQSRGRKQIRNEEVVQLLHWDLHRKSVWTKFCRSSLQQNFRILQVIWRELNWIGSAGANCGIVFGITGKGLRGAWDWAVVCGTSIGYCQSSCRAGVIAREKEGVAAFCANIEWTQRVICSDTTLWRTSKSTLIWA